MQDRKGFFPVPRSQLYAGDTGIFPGREQDSTGRREERGAGDWTTGGRLWVNSRYFFPAPQQCQEKINRASFI